MLRAQAAGVRPLRFLLAPRATRRWRFRNPSVSLSAALSPRAACDSSLALPSSRVWLA